MRYTYTCSGVYEVTSAYSRRSNFFPPISIGFSMYLVRVRARGRGKVRVRLGVGVGVGVGVRVLEVPLHDIGLRLRVVRFPSVVLLPVRDLAELVEEEDALALRAAAEIVQVRVRARARARVRARVNAVHKHPNPNPNPKQVNACAPPMGFMIQKAPAFWFLNSWLGLGPGSGPGPGLGSGVSVLGS